MGTPSVVPAPATAPKPLLSRLIPLALVLTVLVASYLPQLSSLPAPLQASGSVFSVALPAPAPARSPPLAGAPPLPLPLPPPPRTTHPLSTLYSCPPHTGARCSGTSNSDLVDAAYEHIARQVANQSAWGGGACQWRAPSPAHFTVAWPAGVSAEAVAAAQAPGGGAALCLPLGVPHALTLQARDAQGQPVCAGGDYLEAQLEGAGVRARPWTRDNGDGTYTLTLLLPDDELLVGSASLSVGHLFSGLAGLAWNPFWEAGSSRTALALPPTRLRFARWGSSDCLGGAPPAAAPPPARPRHFLPAPTASCRTLDFMSQAFWRGHWVAQPANASACRAGACTGSPAGVLTQPWVYRLPHCALHLFSRRAARACLNGSWIFGSGDSTMLDTLGNLMVGTLGLATGGWVDMPATQPRGRNFDAPGEWAQWNASLGSGPSGPMAENWRGHLGGGGGEEEPGEEPGGGEPEGAFWGRFSNIWNAATETQGALHEQCCQGLTVVHNQGWRGRHSALLGPWAPSGMGPDVLLVNSGMHDGMRFSLNLDSFRDYALYMEESAPEWWGALRDMASGGRAACAPRMVWRSTYAPAGSHRTKRSNPQHMEVFNRMAAMSIRARDGEREWGGGGGEVEGAVPPMPPPAVARGSGGACRRPQQGARRHWDFIDAFDMSFPWHHDDKSSDGGHYGRHFAVGVDNVDRVMIQALLNGLCPLA